MKLGIKKAMLGAIAAALTLSSPMSALAEDTVVISIGGWGDWVLVSTTVCITGSAGSICHTSKHWEWRSEKQIEVTRCDGLCD